MLKTGQNISQKQSMQQKLSPQQIQFVKLLQLPTIGLEQRIKEEIEMNPVLEEAGPETLEETIQEESNIEEKPKEKENDSEVDPVDQNDDIDWDSFLHNTEYDGSSYSGSSSADEDWKDLPNPYHESLLEELEHQVSLLDLDENEKLIADQILGSLDEDGYFRREIDAVVDNIAFNHGVRVDTETVESIRKQIQNLEPVGIASRDLRDCLLCQARNLDLDKDLKKLVVQLLGKEWESFEKKHFDKLKNRLNIDGEQLKNVFEIIKGLDPKPGSCIKPGG
jgi:RNA polymerase sigma-54 factor